MNEGVHRALLVINSSVPEAHRVKTAFSREAKLEEIYN